MFSLRVFCVSLASIALCRAAEPPTITPAGTFATGAAVNAIASEGCYVYFVDNVKTLRNVDFANPDAPTWITWRNLSGEGIYVAAHGSLVATADNSRRVTFFDFAKPSAPVKLKELSFANGPYGIGLTDDLALIGVALEGLYIYDISDRTNPVQKGMLVSSQSRDTVIHGRTAFIVDPFEGVRIVDLTDPVAPQTVGSCSSWVNAIALSWPLLYVASGIEKATLEIFNVSKPAQPQRLGSYTISNLANSSRALDIAAFGPLVAFPSQKHGFDIFDISSPSLPKSIFHEEAWFAKLVAVSRDFVIFHDENVGLKAYRVTLPGPPKLTIQSTGAAQTITWPTAYTGYSLQATATLGVEWQPVTDSAVSIDNSWTQTVNTNEPSQYLQLLKNP